MTYTGKWTCDKCGDTSDNEHDACSCDDECTEHVETIRALRSSLSRCQTESEIRRCKVEELTAIIAATSEQLVGYGVTANSPATLAHGAAIAVDSHRWMTDRRDELKAELARVRAALDEREADMHIRIRAGYDKTVADSWRAEVERLTSERDAARWLSAERMKAIEADHRALTETEAQLNNCECERDEARDRLRVTEEQFDALGSANERLVAFEKRHGVTLESIEQPNMVWVESSAMDRLRALLAAATARAARAEALALERYQHCEELHAAMGEPNQQVVAPIERLKAELATANARAEKAERGLAGERIAWRDEKSAMLLAGGEYQRLYAMTCHERDQAAAQERERCIAIIESNPSLGDDIGGIGVHQRMRLVKLLRAGEGA